MSRRKKFSRKQKRKGLNSTKPPKKNKEERPQVTPRRLLRKLITFVCITLILMGIGTLAYFLITKFLLPLFPLVTISVISAAIIIGILELLGVDYASWPPVDV